MGNALAVIKGIIDGCTAAGNFKNAESVVHAMEAYRYIAQAVEVFERVGDRPPGNNSERTMPKKSNPNGESRPLSDEDHDKYFPDEAKRVIDNG